MSEVNLSFTTGMVESFKRKRVGIERADWLTDPLVDAGVLGNDFRGSRIAPLVIALVVANNGKMNRRKKSPNSGGSILALAGSIGDEGSLCEPTTSFNPHNSMKDRARKALEAYDNQAVCYPGYFFPDVARGSIYLDDQMADIGCSAEALKPAAQTIAEVLGIGFISVGNIVLVSNPYGYQTPESLPSVVRTVLVPNKKTGKIDTSNRNLTAGFRSAVKEIASLRN